MHEQPTAPAGTTSVWYTQEALGFVRTDNQVACLVTQPCITSHCPEAISRRTVTEIISACEKVLNTAFVESHYPRLHPPLMVAIQGPTTLKFLRASPDLVFIEASNADTRSFANIIASHSEMRELIERLKPYG